MPWYTLLSEGCHRSAFKTLLLSPKMKDGYDVINKAWFNELQKQVIFKLSILYHCYLVCLLQEPSQVRLIFNSYPHHMSTSVPATLSEAYISFGMLIRSSPKLEY